MKKYLLTLNGYGAESIFLRLNQDQYSYWFQQQKNEEIDIVDYIQNPDECADIPNQHNFLLEGDEYISIEDSDLIFLHYSSADLDSCSILIEEIFDDKSVKEILDEKLREFLEKHECIHYVESDIKFEDIPDQVLEYHSSEKGTMFGDCFETEGFDDFDPSLLKFIVKESPNGCDYIDSIFYNDQKLGNSEGFSRGKGCQASVWEK
jgi:hypothetical protein